MRKTKKLLCVFAILLSNYALAGIFTMTFENPSVSFQQGYGEGDQYVEGDYFVSTKNTPGHYGGVIRFNPFNQNALVPNNGTIHMGVTYFSNPWLQRTDGASFSLISLDIAEYSEHVTTTKSIPIIGYKSDGTALSCTLSIDRKFDGYGGIDDFQNYTLNWTDVVRVEFHQQGFSFDNIALVPEPASVLLMLLGTAWIAAKRKR